MINELITHQTINGKYRMVFEQAASTKGVLGFKVEANDDDESVCINKAMFLLAEAQKMAKNFAPEVK